MMIPTTRHEDNFEVLASEYKKRDLVREERSHAQARTNDYATLSCPSTLIVPLHFAPRWQHTQIRFSALSFSLGQRMSNELDK